VYGRVVHLEPMQWKNNWPVIGMDKDGDGKGEPVLTYKKPNVGKTYPVQTPAESDEFNANIAGLQWQWMANPQPYFSFMNTAEGTLRLYDYHNADSARNLWQQPNVLLQKLPAEECRFTTKLSFKPNTKSTDERAGLVMMGMSYAGLSLHAYGDSIKLEYLICKDAEEGNSETATTITTINAPVVYLRIVLHKEGRCTFSYSTDGKAYTTADKPFQAVQGKWIGAKASIFCTGTQKSNDSGYADFDWFRIEPANDN
jgi:beta-xylosidase